MDTPFVYKQQPADVRDVRQQAVERVLVEWPASTPFSLFCRPLFRSPATTVQHADRVEQRPVLEVQLEDLPNPGRLAVIDRQP